MSTKTVNDNKHKTDHIHFSKQEILFQTLKDEHTIAANHVSIVSEFTMLAHFSSRMQYGELQDRHWYTTSLRRPSFAAAY